MDSVEAVVVAVKEAALVEVALAEAAYTAAYTAAYVDRAYLDVNLSEFEEKNGYTTTVEEVKAEAYNKAYTLSELSREIKIAVGKVVAAAMGIREDEESRP